MREKIVCASGRLCKHSFTWQSSSVFRTISLTFSHSGNVSVGTPLFATNSSSGNDVGFPVTVGLDVGVSVGVWAIKELCVGEPVMVMGLLVGASVAGLIVGLPVTGLHVGE